MSTLEELLLAAEYIMARGNLDVALCERGIRSFEPYTHNTLGISALPALQVIEVHPEPDRVTSDGPQSMTFDGFEHMMHDPRRVADAVGRSI